MTDIVSCALGAIAATAVAAALTFTAAASPAEAEVGPERTTTIPVTTETPEGRDTCEGADYRAVIFIVGYRSGETVSTTGDCQKQASV
ncbi:hypothetical protein [Actinocorallia sp. A-T 12471]|uniref:hypothetical protein n=1 Tax=Actinocorallia sp. A-T 12471 TaxID=3089813 RepID=UPI0029D25BA2|nr:hypothetical protein [Actinocorallia sp. A-T 12471]MDX6740586.1 hypothetical protein [Actinocorallia sp. A-T 12471]